MLRAAGIAAVATAAAGQGIGTLLQHTCNGDFGFFPDLPEVAFMTNLKSVDKFLQVAQFEKDHIIQMVCSGLTLKEIADFDVLDVKNWIRFSDPAFKAQLYATGVKYKCETMMEDLEGFAQVMLSFFDRRSDIGNLDFVTMPSSCTALRWETEGKCAFALGDTNSMGIQIQMNKCDKQALPAFKVSCVGPKCETLGKPCSATGGECGTGASCTLFEHIENPLSESKVTPSDYLNMDLLEGMGWCEKGACDTQAAFNSLFDSLYKKFGWTGTFRPALEDSLGLCGVSDALNVVITQHTKQEDNTRCESATNSNPADWCLANDFSSPFNRCGAYCDFGSLVESGVCDEGVDAACPDSCQKEMVGNVAVCQMTGWYLEETCRRSLPGMGDPNPPMFLEECGGCKVQKWVDRCKKCKTAFPDMMGDMNCDATSYTLRELSKDLVKAVTNEEVLPEKLTNVPTDNNGAELVFMSKSCQGEYRFMQGADEMLQQSFSFPLIDNMLGDLTSALLQGRKGKLPGDAEELSKYFNPADLPFWGHVLTYADLAVKFAPGTTSSELFQMFVKGMDQTRTYYTPNGEAGVGQDHYYSKEECGDPYTSGHTSDPYDYYDYTSGHTSGRSTNNRTNSTPRPSSDPYDYYDYTSGHTSGRSTNNRTNSTPRPSSDPYDYYDYTTSDPYDYYDYTSGHTSAPLTTAPAYNPSCTAWEKKSHVIFRGFPTTCNSKTMQEGKCSMEVDVAEFFKLPGRKTLKEMGETLVLTIAMESCGSTMAYKLGCQGSFCEVLKHPIKSQACEADSACPSNYVCKEAPALEFGRMLVDEFDYCNPSSGDNCKFGRQCNLALNQCIKNLPNFDDKDFLFPNVARALNGKDPSTAPPSTICTVDNIIMSGNGDDLQRVTESNIIYFEKKKSASGMVYTSTTEINLKADASDATTGGTGSTTGGTGSTTGGTGSTTGGTGTTDGTTGGTAIITSDAPKLAGLGMAVAVILLGV